MGPSPSEIVNSIGSALRSFAPLPSSSWRPKFLATAAAPITSPTPPPPAPHLPPEILNLIFDQLPPTTYDLTRYALVSRSWLPHARVALYATVRLPIEEHADAANGWLAMPSDATEAEIHDHMLGCVAREALLLERTLCGDATGAIAELVGTIDVTASNRGHVFEIEPVAELLGRIISRCTSLTDVSLAGANPAQSDALLAALSATAPGLTSFAVACRLDSPRSRAAPSALETFVHAQRAKLGHLHITRESASSFGPLGPWALAMPCLTSLTFKSAFPSPHAQGTVDLATPLSQCIRSILSNSLASLTSLSIDLAWNADLDKFHNLTELTLQDSEHQLFATGRPLAAGVGSLQRPVPLPPSVKTLRFTAPRANATLSRLKELSAAHHATPDRFEWATIVPVHVEVLGLGGLLVHPASLVRWLTGAGARSKLRKIEWGVPVGGWEEIGWGLERDAEELKRVCGRMGVRWAEQPIVAWIEDAAN